MRIITILTVVAFVAACGNSSAQSGGNRDDVTPQASSTFRASFRVSAINRCRIDLTKTGMSMPEIDYACPCMTDEILAVTPNDADLVRPSPQTVNNAVAKCAAKAETRFGARPTASPVGG
jgi:hypothetical protein